MANLNPIETILSLPRAGKRSLVAAADVVAALLAVKIAFYLRLDAWLPFGLRQWATAVAAAFLVLGIFAACGVYRVIHRHVGAATVKSLGTAMLAYAATFATIFTLVGFAGTPRTVGIIQPLILLVFAFALRLAAGRILGGTTNRQGLPTAQRVLIYGSGSAGRQLAAAIGNSRQIQAVAFLDDDPKLHGGLIMGLPVRRPDDLSQLMAKYAARDVLLAIPSAPRRARNAIIDRLRAAGASVRTLPGLMDLAHGSVSTTDLRPLDIEDLLGREPVSPQGDLIAQKVLGLTVLVTGCGGSIGSELCRQIVSAGARRLVLVDVSEFALYAIHRELDERSAASENGPVELIPLLGSVTDEAWMSRVMMRFRPKTVYHAAAYKHVPLVEHNAGIGIANNVLGTRTAALAANAAGARDFVLVSTDKAVRPTNIMGASKRLAELVLQALAGEPLTTRYSMVRFGNVLGSSGSVVPQFRRQIAAGGPVTLTHRDITRYFMTIPEAASLVLQAGAMAIGGEVFVLDMGSPVKIADLAQRVVELSGLSVRGPDNPEGDIEMVVIGLRPGEKLYEELLIGNNPEPTAHARIMKANEEMIPWCELSRSLDEIATLCADGSVTALLAALQQLVPDYAPQSDIVDYQADASAGPTATGPNPAG